MVFYKIKSVVTTRTTKPVSEEVSPVMDEDPAVDDGGVDPGDESHLDQQPTDPHLLLYSELRDEIGLRVSTNGRNLLTGLSTIGLVVAYGLLSGELVFFAAIPVVVAVLIVQTVFQLNRIMLAGAHLSRIEQAYVDDHPLFSWEHRYGMFRSEEFGDDWNVNWTLVPQVIIFSLAVLGYLGSAYVGYVLWPPGGTDILLIGLSRDGLLFVYAVLTVLVGLAGYSYHRVKTALEAETTTET